MPQFSDHPLYKANEKYWHYYRMSYAMDPDLTTAYNPITGQKYLSKKPLENNEDYIKRVREAVLCDLVTPGVDLVCGTIDNDIHIEIPDAFSEIANDCDLQDTPILAFMSEARKIAAIYGVAYILVDSTRAETEINTQADAIANGIRPFLRILTPLDLHNWRLNSNGQIIECWYEVTPESEESILESSEVEECEKRYWSVDKWQVYKDNKLIAEGENPLGYVPIVPLYHIKKQPMLGISLIRAAASYQQQLTNWLSDISKIQEMQSFALPVLHTNQNLQDIGLGSTTVLKLSPGNKDSNADQFSYVAPDVAPLELAWRSFEQTREMCLTSMQLPGDVFQQNKTAPESGVSKAYRWQSLDKRCRLISRNEESALREVMDVVAHWMGYQQFDGTIQYPQQFDLSSADDAITNLLSLSASGLPKIAMDELKKKAIATALPAIDSKKMQEISDAIDQQPDMNSRVDLMTGMLNNGN